VEEDSPGTGPALVPFPAFTESGLKDYAGRSVEQSLDAVRALTGLSLPVTPSPGRAAAGGLLGRRFWAALIRGGYQGAAYIVDLLYGGKPDVSGEEAGDD
jgi:hypothetical protein